RRRTGQTMKERRDCDALEDEAVETVRMSDVEGRSDARVTEDRDAAGGLGDVIGPIGVGDEDEHGFVEDGIQARADGPHLGLLGQPSAVDGRYIAAASHHHGGFDIYKVYHLRRTFNGYGCS